MWGRILAGLAVVLAAVLGYLAYRVQKTAVVRLDDRFYAVLGGGGNSAVLLGDDGVLVVDTKMLRPGRRLAAIIASLTDKPVKTIVNTHYHADHTHGNPNYPPGVDVVAQRRTRAHLLERDKRYWEVEPAWSFLPGDPVDDEKELRVGDEVVRVLHPGRGHTDGDVVVHFARRGVVHTGDLFLHDMYPFLDLRAGGSARQWIASLDRVLAIEGVNRYIPGHGHLATRADVVRFQDYLRRLVGQVEELAKAGRGLRDVVAGVELGEFDDFSGIPFFTSRTRNIEWVYQEVSGRKH